MSVLQQLQGFVLSRNRPDQSEDTERQSARLYHCDSCGQTYVSQTMESCPECDGAIENVPTGRDLGQL